MGSGEVREGRGGEDRIASIPPTGLYSTFMPLEYLGILVVDL